MTSPRFGATGAVLARRFADPHRAIARDMGTVAVFLLVAKVAGALNEVAVARTFGTGPVVDAYLFVFNLISIPAALWYSVASIVVIPLAAKLRHADPREELRFCAELSAAVIATGVVAGLAAWAILRLLFDRFSFGLEPVTHGYALTAINYLAFAIPLGLAANQGSVLLMSRGRHANSLLEGSMPLTILVVLLLWPAGGLRVLLWGTIGGLALQLAITVALLARHMPLPRLRLSSTGWASFGNSVKIVLVIQLLLALTGVIDQLFAADLAGGSIATLGYATRILSLFLSLGATAIGRATLPIYSQLRNTDADALSGIARRWSLILFLAGCAMAAAVWPFSELLVRLLFERGAFTAEDSARVARVLGWGLTQLPFYFALIASSQYLFTSDRHKLAAWAAFVALSAKVLFSFLLVGPLGVSGLMVSTAIAQAASCILILAVLGRSAFGRRTK